jgi:hypothetical protein
MKTRMKTRMMDKDVKDGDAMWMKCRFPFRLFGN